MTAVHTAGPFIHAANTTELPFRVFSATTQGNVAYFHSEADGEFFAAACNSHDALVEKLTAQFRAVDWLMAKLIAADPEFMPSQSPIWESIKGTHAVLTAAGAA